MIRYGEDRWHDLSHAPSHSIKGYVYKAGRALVDKIPAKEWMLWRAYTLHRQSIAQALTVENYIKEDHQLLRGMLKEEFNNSALIHKRWALIHGVGLIPATVLMLLPGGKLIWAWLAFRFITHQRASIGAKWLSSIIADTTKFTIINNDPGGLQRALTELPELRLLMDKLK
jgi:K+-H+ exchange-related protein